MIVKSALWSLLIPLNEALRNIKSSDKSLFLYSKLIFSAGIVDTFPISSNRFQKYITYIRDKRFVAQRQLMLVDLLHDNSRAYMNQYARVETAYDQGSFDFSITGTDGRLEFHPVNSSVTMYLQK